MEISGTQALQNESVAQSKDIALMKKGMDIEKEMVSQLVESLPKGGVNSSAAVGSQVNIQA